DTTSALATLAAVSIASTTSGGVATNRTSGTRVCAPVMRADAPVETASGTNAVTIRAIVPSRTLLRLAERTDDLLLIREPEPDRQARLLADVRRGVSFARQI